MPTVYPGAPLNEKEILILRLMCQEKSTKEIASELGCSPRTIETNRTDIKIKTGKISIAGLVMYAICQGYDKEEAPAPAS